MENFRYQKTRSELILAFRDQMNFLVASCKSYDNGNLSEARRIANAVYILLFDGSGSGRNSRSLFSSLGYKNSIKLISTASPIDYDNAFREFALASLGGNGFEPNYRFPTHVLRNDKMSHGCWWEQIIYKADGFTDQATMSRKNLLFHLRSQDGGSHVDTKVKSKSYYDLAFKGGGWCGYDASGNLVQLHPHLAMMRQIGYEVEYSVMGASPAILQELQPDT